MSLYARCELPGFSAFLGGVVAQEVLKAPGKFRPLSQWLHHDAIELLADSPPTDALRLPNEQPTRYEHQVPSQHHLRLSIFPWNFCIVRILAALLVSLSCF